MEPMHECQILRIADEMGSIDRDEVVDHTRPQAAVEAPYLDGSLPPRRCCAPGCRVEIDGPPLVSQGLPYHPDCYLETRRHASRVSA